MHTCLHTPSPTHRLAEGDGLTCTHRKLQTWRSLWEGQMLAPCGYTKGLRVGETGQLMYTPADLQQTCGSVAERSSGADLSAFQPPQTSSGRAARGELVCISKILQFCNQRAAGEPTRRIILVGRCTDPADPMRHCRCWTDLRTYAKCSLL